MAARNTISQRISLEGADEIRRQLAELGMTLQQSFGHDIKIPGMVAMLDGVGNLVPAIDNLVKDVGTAAIRITALGAAAAGAAAGFFLLLRSAANSVDTLSDLANESQTTIGNMQALQQVFAESGVGANQMETAFARLATRVETAWEQIGKASKGAADKVVADKLAIETAALRLGKAETDLANSVRDAAQRQIDNHLAVRSAMQNLERAEFSLANVSKAQAQIRINNIKSIESAQRSLINAQAALEELTSPATTEEERKELQIQKAQLAVLEAEKKLREEVAEARKRQAEADEKAGRDEEAAQLARLQAQSQLQKVIEKEGDDAAAASRVRAQQELAAEQARLQISQARRKLAEDNANDINNLAKYVDNLSKGITNAGLQVNVTTDNLVKGIVKSVGAGAEGIKEISGGLVSIANAAPSTFDVLLKIAAIFEKMPDGPEKAALGIKLLGRNSRDMVEALSKGPDHILKMREELQRTGIGFTGLDEKAGNAFHDILKGATALSTAARDKLLLIFAPVATSTLEKFKSSLKEGFGGVEAFFKEIERNVSPVIEALGNSILGLPSPEFNEADFAKATVAQREHARAVQEWQATFDVWRKAIVDFFTVTLPSVFATVRERLEEVATGFNKIFGTKLTGDELGIALLVGQLTGLNKVVIDLTGIFINLGAIILGLFLINPVGAAIFVGLAGLAAAALLVANNWDKVTAAIASATAELSKWNIFSTEAANNPLARALLKLFGGGVAPSGAGAGGTGTTDPPLSDMGPTASPDVVAAVKEQTPALVQSTADASAKDVAAITQAETGIVNALTAGLNQETAEIIHALNESMAAIRAVEAAILSTASRGGGGSINEMAGGGQIRGRPGRDTNLAWLTDKEYVMQVPAVKKYGVAFMRAINSGQLPKDILALLARLQGLNRGGLFDALPRFNTGGLMEGLNRSLSALAIPRFDSGGLALAPAAGSGGPVRTFNLTFGNQTFGGLTGPDKVMDALERHAVSSQLSSAGYKPGWYK